MCEESTGVKLLSIWLMDHDCHNERYPVMNWWTRICSWKLNRNASKFNQRPLETCCLDVCLALGGELKWMMNSKTTKKYTKIPVFPPWMKQLWRLEIRETHPKKSGKTVNIPQVGFWIFFLGGGGPCFFLGVGGKITTDQLQLLPRHLWEFL